MNCKISVIVPVYNSEEYLYKCIDSILNQSFKDIELILVNDGSTDNSGNICDEYKKYDNRVRVVHIDNYGVSNARNVGIENATGEYIVFSDSDDYVEYTWCEELYRVAIEKKNSLVVCGCKIKNERLQSYEIENLLNKNSYLDIISKQHFFKLYTSNLLNSPCNKIFKRETLLKYNIRYDRELSLGEDMLFNLEYLKYTDSNEIYVINKSLYNYILREHESLDNKYYEDLFDIYKRLYKDLYSYMLELGVDFREYESDFWTSYFYMIERVLTNTYSYKNKMSKKEKYKYNKNIVKSNEFSQCIKNISKDKINRLYLALLKTKNYFIISNGLKLINKISSVKKMILSS